MKDSLGAIAIAITTMKSLCLYFIKLLILTKNITAVAESKIGKMEMRMGKKGTLCILCISFSADVIQLCLIKGLLN